MNSPWRQESLTYRALVVTADTNLLALSHLLQQQGIAHGITEEAGQQVVWVANAAQGAEVVGYYQQWQAGVLTFDLPAANTRRWAFNWMGQIPWQQYPVTWLLMAGCLLVALMTRLGDAWPVVAALNLVPFQIINTATEQHGYFATLATVWEQRQYWRLITPIFLHFGSLHLTFNLLWLFEIGRRIEAKQGRLPLLLLVLTTGIAANLCQYRWGEPAAIAGGFSGVIYGLLGYCLIQEKVGKHCQFGLLPALYGFMLFFLVVGYTGLLDPIVGNLANGAHTGGLLAGALIGGLAVICRQRQ